MSASLCDARSTHETRRARERGYDGSKQLHVEFRPHEEPRPLASKASLSTRKALHPSTSPAELPTPLSSLGACLDARNVAAPLLGSDVPPAQAPAPLPSLDPPHLDGGFTSYNEGSNTPSA